MVCGVGWRQSQNACLEGVTKGLQGRAFLVAGDSVHLTNQRRRKDSGQDGYHGEDTDQFDQREGAIRMTNDE